MKTETMVIVPQDELLTEEELNEIVGGKRGDTQTQTQTQISDEEVPL
ncbi:hypothetical protein [Bacteroides sp. 51]|nr:hypothetical protein [Bacteroides sp. 51]